MKTFCNFEPQIWLEIITSRDAKSACFKGSRTSCREIIFGIFGPNPGRKRSHHVMDASCRQKIQQKRDHKTRFKSHRAPKEKTVSVTQVFMVPKEDQQQSLHYFNSFTQESYAVTLPATCAENNSPKQKERYVIILSLMVNPLTCSRCNFFLQLEASCLQLSLLPTIQSRVWELFACCTVGVVYLHLELLMLTVAKWV